MAHIIDYSRPQRRIPREREPSRLQMFLALLLLAVGWVLISKTFDVIDNAAIGGTVREKAAEAVAQGGMACYVETVDGATVEHCIRTVFKK